MKNSISSTLVFLLFACFQIAIGQNMGVEILMGKVLDETGMGIPMADVYVKEQPQLRTRADINGDYIMRLEEGPFRLVFQAMGYEQKEVFAIVKEGENKLDVQLYPMKVNDLDEFYFSTKKTNPGRDIMLKVVEKKDQIDHNQFSYSCDVYIKAKETKSNFNKKQNDDSKEEDDIKTVEQEKNKKLGELNNISMVEVELQRNFSPPNNVREFRNAYTKRGNDNRMFYTTTVKEHINFFENILYLNTLTASPIQSPISNAGILSYKYKLVEKIEREGLPILNKIKIIPRSTSVSSLEGFIYVQDGSWMVEQIDFKIIKGNLLFYDYFEINQKFDVSNREFCLLIEQNFNYGVDYKNEGFASTTIAKFENYNFQPAFGKKFFSNEVAVTTKEAYERDTSYWEQKRTLKLSEEERNYIRKRDSIENLFTKTTYLDSIDSVFNVVNFWKVVWFGVDRRNRAKKQQWTLSSLAAMTRPVYIAGPRFGPDFDYFKKIKDERTFEAFIRADIGLLNKDIKGNFFTRYRYNPFNFATIGISLDHDYDLIRSFDAFSQVLLRENFIETTKYGVYHYLELVNGLTLRSDLKLAQRRPIGEDIKFVEWFDDVLDNNEPPVFDPYNAFIADFTLSYTPFQKYMREPYRKVILGSRWPTFYAYYEKGIENVLRSTINHDYLRFGIQQNFKIGTLGTSSYHATGGKFLNAKKLEFFDYKFHRRSDPIWFSNPLYSFQDLDTSLPTLDWYFEAHYIHHFNGALINKIPYMKKTRIGLVAGAGYLYVPEHNWQHYEFFVGMERIFKFAKRRLRIGLYAVASDGNQITPRTTGKISFALLDRRNMKFNF